MASAVAAISAFAGVYAAIHGVVFTRTEGEDLAKRVDKLEQQTREDLKGVREDVRALTIAVLGKKSAALHKKSGIEVAEPAGGPKTVAQMRHESGIDFFLHSFGEPVDLDKRAWKPGK